MNNRGGGGKFSEKVGDDDILRVFLEADDPFLTASEVAERVPLTKSAVNYRLNKMREKGVVARKEVGARAVGWWALVKPDMDAPAAPLRDLVGMMDAGEAERAQERSAEWRDEFNERMSAGN